MKLEVQKKMDAYNKYNPFRDILKIPKGTVLSPERVKVTEKGLKNTKIVRETLTDYFERKGKTQDEKAYNLDLCLMARESFLRMKLHFFEKSEIEKRQKIVDNIPAMREQFRKDMQNKQITVAQWLSPFTI